MMLFHRAWQWMLRFVSPAAFAAAGVFVITVLALLVPPYIGMADNGDYFRILNSNGLFFNDPNYMNHYLGYFVKNYGIYQYYNENGATFFSTQSWFIKASMWMSQLIHPSTTFDIRYQAGMYMLLYTGAVYLLVEALTWNIARKLGYLIAAIAIFIFGDTAYTAYFNSFYGESVVLIMMVYMVAFGLLLYRKRYNDYAMISLFVLSAMILTASKQQNAPVGIITALLGIFFIFIREKRGYRLVTGMLLIALLGVGIGSYVLIPKEFELINKYHAMTRGVLLNSADPEKALESFHIDKQYAILTGSLYYDPYTPYKMDSPEMKEQFFDKYGFGSILVYYITHPDHAGKMLNIAAQEGFTIRPNAMGNYEASVGKAFGAHTAFFSGYSWLKEATAPKTFGFILIWIVVICGLYMPSFVYAIRSQEWRESLRFVLIFLFIVIGLSGIFVSIIGAGDADLGKHEFLFTLSFDVVSLITLRDLLAKQLWNNRSIGRTTPVQAGQPPHGGQAIQA
ncbi:glycan biosynthesis hexose transferase WsfD [Paenibacillus roseipurpureus]|uniref:Transmembrane protein n=1 Tax=Paenibacillus roseopurpureus TaxID=2918901 RepID=A0AA96LM38_9BACL|nr:hypothetical protein [Paenibacillus sp. MBLB1832]WNR42324.1 hypothetical protein MJB10_14380 [Paenibacillus sp. MBLB1832]